MKKYLTLLLALMITLSLVNLNVNKVSAENDIPSCTTSTEAGATCSISNETEFNAWAANTNGLVDYPVTGKLTADITVSDQVHIKSIKALDLDSYKLRGSFTSQPDPRKANYKEHILYVDGNSSLILSATTGEINGDNLRGGIMNEGILTINSGTITQCAAHSGAGVYNINTFTMNGGTISYCNGAYQDIDGYGGGVYNHNGVEYGPVEGATFNFKSGTITNCGSYYGGGIYIAYPGTFVMGGDSNSANIKDCYATFSGGALNGVGKVTLKGGTVITGNYSANCAIIAPLDLTIEGSGNITIKNVNPNDSLQKDILVLHNKYYESEGDPKLKIKNNPTITDPIYISMQSTGYTTETLQYVLPETTGTSYKDKFRTIEADQYLEENTVTKFLTIQKIKIQDQPTFSNGYTVGIGTHDLVNNNMEVNYQWKYAKNINKIQIGNVGNYKTADNVIDINVTNNSSARYSNYSWTGSSISLMIKGLKKDQLISFDFEIPSGSEDAHVSLMHYKEIQGGMSIEAVKTKNVDVGSSTYSVLVPADSTNTDYYGIAINFNNEDESKVAKMSNIFIKAPDDGEVITGETNNKLNMPISDKNVYCDVTITNKNYGSDPSRTKTITSNVVEFATIDGDKEFYLGDNDPLVLKIKADDASYNNFVTNGEVYLDDTSESNKLVKGTDYTISKGSIVLNITSSKLKNLEPNKYHSIFVTNITSSAGFNYATALFYVNAGKKPTPTPSPKKDESCEKVIGPTWHWNNKKGICEDTGVVKTFTR